MSSADGEVAKDGEKENKKKEEFSITPTVGKEQVKDEEVIRQQEEAARQFDLAQHEREMEEIKKGMELERQRIAEERAKHDELVRRQINSGDKTEDQQHQEFIDRINPQIGIYDEVDRHIFNRLAELGKEYNTLQKQNTFRPDVRDRLSAINTELEALKRDYQYRDRKMGIMRFRLVPCYYPEDNAGENWLLPHADGKSYEACKAPINFGFFTDKDRTSRVICDEHGKPVMMKRRLQNNVFHTLEPTYVWLSYDVEIVEDTPQPKEDPKPPVEKKSLLSKVKEKLTPTKQEKEAKSEEIAEPITGTKSQFTQYIHCGQCQTNYEANTNKKCPQCGNPRNDSRNTFL